MKCILYGSKYKRKKKVYTEEVQDRTPSPKEYKFLVVDILKGYTWIFTYTLVNL